MRIQEVREIDSTDKVNAMLSESWVLLNTYRIQLEDSDNQKVVYVMGKLSQDSEDYAKSELTREATQNSDKADEQRIISFGRIPADLIDRPVRPSVPIIADLAGVIIPGTEGTVISPPLQEEEFGEDE